MGLETRTSAPPEYEKAQSLRSSFPEIVKSRAAAKSDVGESASQSEYGANSPRPFFAASIGATLIASFGAFDFFGKNLTFSPHGATHRSPSFSHFAELSSCGQLQP